jgi:1-acyl-sn-glycerol-3-phosphate acyltransferase
LAEGDCLGIYPEGTRSPDGRLYKGRTGIARLAMESGAPVIPAAMFNTHEIQPTGKLVPNIKRVKMQFGEPMYFSGDSTDMNTLRDVTDEIMRKIQSMSGQEYVDMYATKRKSEIAEEE